MLLFLRSHDRDRMIYRRHRRAFLLTRDGRDKGKWSGSGFIQKAFMLTSHKEIKIRRLA
jgi:hypothetical protein